MTPEDLETTLLTLETLAEIPEELARKEVKDVKRAVFALHKVMAEGMTLGMLFRSTPALCRKAD